MTVPQLDPLIHQPTRLQIMTALYRNRLVSFTDLRDGLAITPGNIASHVARLEDAGYLRSGRLLVDLSFQVHYRITEAGAEAYRRYLAGLAQLLGVGVAVEAQEPPGVEGPGAPDGSTQTRRV